MAIDPAKPPTRPRKGGATPLNLAGQRFGRLLVLDNSESRPAGPGRTEIFWLCRCDCGVEKWIRTRVMREGNTLSCGCLKAEMPLRGARWAAQQRGELTYRPDKPCRRCGTSERRADNGNCCECDRIVQRTRGITYREQYPAEYATRVRKWVKQKRATDLQFRLRIALRGRLHYALRGNPKVGSAVRDLGCSIIELKLWLEDQFHPGMTWENWGPVWHIDHVRSLAEFDLTDRKQFLQACHYTNLQPLFAQDHWSKPRPYRSRTPRVPIP